LTAERVGLASPSDMALGGFVSTEFTRRSGGDPCFESGTRVGRSGLKRAQVRVFGDRGLGAR
jgi:hypothetical protein